MVTTFAGFALLPGDGRRVRDARLLGPTSRTRFRREENARCTIGEVIRLVIESAARVIVIGAIVRLVLSAVLGRLITTILFSVSPLDPIVFAIVLAVLVITAAITAAAPA